MGVVCHSFWAWVGGRGFCSYFLEWGLVCCVLAAGFLDFEHQEVLVLEVVALGVWYREHGIDSDSPER